MSSDVVIRAEGAGKAYAIFDRPEHRLKQMLFGRRRRYYTHFWALQATNLEIRRGETWGIIGRNGSGKSTLLQMICGNVSPTTGTVSVRGKIAALLELGAGFNPEFTGRENVYINGTIAGYGRRDIDERLDQILAFADIGEFVDQPVKTYSSGMFARLAFAIAINVDPDILIVDEALAVGDEAFQRKCFARMERIKADGATILFVSHATSTVVDLCDHAVLLHRGERLMTGQPKAVVGWYQKLTAAPEGRVEELLQTIRDADHTVEVDATSGVGRHPASAGGDGDESEAFYSLGVGDVGTTPDSEVDAGETACFDPSLISTSVFAFVPKGAEITEVRLLTPDGERVNTLVPRKRYRFCYRVTFFEAARYVKFYFMTKTLNGVHLGGGTFPSGVETLPSVEAGHSIDVHFEFRCALRGGTYFVNCGVAAGGELLHRILDALAFRVGRGAVHSAIGTVDFDVSAELRHLHVEV